ncbi:MAG: transcriptional repressor, partial [Bacteroidales bacterium]|nr:transcriptional repressor [Bacteroidales bacterium]
IHPTVDQIFQELHPTIPTLSKTTVYNTLKLLEDHGVIQSILIDEKNVRYDANANLHAHFKCKGCGEIFDIHLENTEITNIKSVKGFNVTECLIYYKGFCEKCKTN